MPPYIEIPTQRLAKPAESRITLRRGTNAWRLSAKLKADELWLNTDDGRLFAGDGSTVGGVLVKDGDPRVVGVTVQEVTSDLVLEAPTGEPEAGERVKYYIEAVGGDRNLKFANSVVLPSDSTFDNEAGKTLLSGKRYIVQLEYLGNDWGLTTIVGGY